jgi:hypothetical protein
MKIHPSPFHIQPEACVRPPVVALNNVQADCPTGAQAPQPGCKVSVRRLIGPDEAQAGAWVAEVCQQRHGAIAVLDTGGGDHHGQP